MAGNYTGPYWSDGKIQPSVEFGTAEPLDYVDEMSRLHDSAYAKYAGDPDMLRAADELYYEALQKDPSTKSKVAASAVLYGNYTADRIDRLAKIEKISSMFGPIGLLAGLVYFAGDNIVSLSKRLTGDPLSKQKQVLREYYRTDPRVNTVRSVPSLPVASPMPETGQAYYWPSPDVEDYFYLPRRKRRRRRRKKNGQKEEAK